MDGKQIVEELRAYAQTFGSDSDVGTGINVGIILAAKFIEDKETIPSVPTASLRRCKGKTSVYEDGKWHTEEFELGYFHQWGSNYEEFEGGPGNFTVAIVELPDGRIVMPMADDITFIND